MGNGSRLSVDPATDDIDASIAGDPMIPKSILNQLRRDLIAKLEALGHTVTLTPTAA